MTDLHKWVIHGERLVDDTPHVRVSLVDVKLPDGVRFTQYVFRMRRCAMTVVLDDPGERLLLLMLRHRFIVDRWVWELPGGYVDDGEDSAAAAAREVEEETGWRPRRMEYVLSCREIPDCRAVRAGPEPPHKVAYVTDAPGRGEAHGQVEGLPSDVARLLRLVLCRVGRGKQGQVEGPAAHVAAVHVQ